MGSDASPTTPSDLLDVTNGTIHPNPTADATGGIDLAAINGLEFQYTPEPSVWAMLCLGALPAPGAHARRLREQASG